MESIKKFEDKKVESMSTTIGGKRTPTGGGSDRCVKRRAIFGGAHFLITNKNDGNPFNNDRNHLFG